ncbi:MAG: S46 family peptidase [Gammaproteobacteria bacterium]
MKASPALILLGVTTAALAEEGMWTPDNFPAERVEESYGVTIDQQWLDRARLSTVRLTGPGGCTGSFVSSLGLILTNRHCVESCLAEHTNETRDVWNDGFYATSPGTELRCSDLQAAYLTDIREVTTLVNAATEGLEEVAANDARRQTFTRLEQECETASQTDARCEIVSLYQGGQYFLYETRRYDDVRLVFAPDVDIGKFGGDPDNFSFPRWTLDMAFLRAYQNDEPVSPDAHLTWRRDGPERDEAVFVTGHPGTTQRQLTVAEYQFLRNAVLPSWLIRNAELLGRYREFALRDPESRRMVQEDLERLENGVKFFRNQLAALLDDRLMVAKSMEEKTFREAVASQRELAAGIYAWHQVDRALAALSTFYDEYIMVERRGGFQGELMDQARALIRAATERDKPNEKRLRGYTDSQLPLVEQRVSSTSPIHMPLESLKVTFGLEKLREILGHDHPIVRKTLGNESPESMANRLIANTSLDDPAVRKKLWEGGLKAVERSKDPIIRLMRAVDGDARELLDRYLDEYQAPLREAHQSIARARFAILGTSVYPDATFTFRISYGTVSGWTESGREIDPFTRLEGVYERATGEKPYALSEAWLDARPSLDMSTPVNYVGTLDLTAGNSGSPVIDADGRIVGLAFDGNQYSIAGSFWYDIEKNRAIAVHPAIMIEALERVYKADRLLAEIELSKD